MNLLQDLPPSRLWTESWPFIQAAALILLVIVMNLTLRWFGDQIIGKMVRSLKDEVQENIGIQSLGADDPKLDGILSAKFRDINRRASHHLTMVCRLGTLLFIQMSMVLAQSGFAAIALFFVARQGWSHQENLPLLIVFAVCATAAAVYGALPSAFKMTDNFRANIFAYTQLLQLSDSMRTYAYTASTTKESPAEFLLRLDKALAANRTIAFAFDTSKLPAISALLTELMDTAKPSGRETGAGLQDRRPAPEQAEQPQAETDQEQDRETQTGSGSSEGKRAHA